MFYHSNTHVFAKGSKEKSLRVALLANKLFAQELLERGLTVSTKILTEEDPITNGWRWIFVLNIKKDVYEASDIDFNEVLKMSTHNAMLQLNEYPNFVSMLEVRST